MELFDFPGYHKQEGMKPLADGFEVAPPLCNWIRWPSSCHRCWTGVGHSFLALPAAICLLLRSTVVLWDTLGPKKPLRQGYNLGCLCQAVLFWNNWKLSRRHEKEEILSTSQACFSLVDGFPHIFACIPVFHKKYPPSSLGQIFFCWLLWAFTSSLSWFTLCDLCHEGKESKVKKALVVFM